MNVELSAKDLQACVCVCVCVCAQKHMVGSAHWKDRSQQGWRGIREGNGGEYNHTTFYTYMYFPTTEKGRQLGRADRGEYHQD